MRGRKQKGDEQCRNDFAETWNGFGFVHSRQRNWFSFNDKAKRL
jgi:hypothetical protein